jgi:hypothetical protein
MGHSPDALAQFREGPSKFAENIPIDSGRATKPRLELVQKAPLVRNTPKFDPDKFSFKNR